MRFEDMGLAWCYIIDLPILSGMAFPELPGSCGEGLFFMRSPLYLQFMVDFVHVEDIMNM